MEIIQSILSNKSGLKTEINSRRKSRKFMTMWKLNNMLLINQKVKEEITKGLEYTLRRME